LKIGPPGISSLDGVPRGNKVKGKENKSRKVWKTAKERGNIKVKLKLKG
jgi:hypothetical protein